MKTLEMRNAGPFAATVAALMIAPASFAEDVSMNTASYEDELERCIVAVRPQLELDNPSLVRHLVSDIERRGPWYVFDIETTVKDSNGIVSVDSLESTCKANRWNDQTRLFVENVEVLQPTRVASTD